MTSSVLGHKGGKSGASSGGFSEAPNTLRSAATARLIDLISEGPCVGIVGGLQGILLDNVPLQNSDLSFNFEGVTVEERFGTPDQDVVSGFPNTETPFALNTVVTKVIPATFIVADTSVDAVRVVLGVSQLTTQSTTDGSLSGASVQMTIEVKGAAGSYVIASTVDINGKTTSPYQRAVRVELPVGVGPWTIRVKRVTADTIANTTNPTTLFGYSEIKDGLFNYPDSAIVALTLDSAKFGTSLKQRTYKYRGLICSVPTNYDPETRIYTGIWNGTFKQAWTNNPAWVLYALMTHPRFGLGQYIPAGSVDKAALYIIGQYCDEMVSDGFGGAEPRYTYNGVLRSQSDAAKVLDTIASVFRGMIYWGAGVVTATIDAPGTATTLVTPANVIDGNFEYVGASLRTRSSSVAVTWNDPSDLGKQSVIIVQRDDLIRKFGERRKDVAAVGCTSRGQAQRVAEWLLYTEEHETEVVSYQASLDHAALRPGALINIADPAYAGARFGGRMVSSTQAGVITLDGPVTFTDTVSNQISTVKPTGEIVTVPVTPLAKNHLIQTRDQSNGVWTKVNTSAVSGTDTAPDGSLTAGSITESATATVNHSVTQSVGMVYAGTNYTFSFYAKRGSGVRHVGAQMVSQFGSANAIFNLITGTTLQGGGSPDVPVSITDVGNGWYRCTMTDVAEGTGIASARITLSNNPSSTNPTYTGDGTSSMLVWGTQFEVGTEAGAYVENTTAVNLIGDFDEVVVGAFALPADVPLNGSMWVVTTSDVAPRLFRVISNTEKASNIYEITAVISNPSKYAHIERNLDLTSTPSTLFSMDGVSPPTSLNAIAYRKQDSGSIAKLAYLVSWKASTDPRVTSYKLWLAEGGEAETLVWEGSDLSVEVPSFSNGAGVFTFRSRAYAFNGDSSEDALLNSDATYAWVPPAVPTGWVGVPGVTSVQLSSPNYSPSPDFQFFRIYSCATIGGTYVLVGTSKTPNFIYTVTAGAVPSYYKISAVDYSGLESTLTSAINLLPANEIGAIYPATPLNLSGSTTLISDGVSRVVFDWDNNSEANIIGYDVAITENGSVPVTLMVSKSRWAGLYKPGTVVTVSVVALNNLGNRSITPTATVSVTALSDITPPAIPTLAAVGAGYGNLYLTWSPNTEVDFDHYEILEQPASTPLPTNQSVGFTYRTTDTTYTRANLAELTTRHFWVRAVDTSGNASNWSVRQQGTTLSLSGTQPAPGVPGSVAVTSAYVADGRSTITVTWTAGTNAVGYDVGVTRAGGAETILFSSLLSATFDAQPDVTYSVRVRSTSIVSAKSAWANAATYPITAAADAVAPAVPTLSAVVAGFAELWVSWSKNSESDFDHYEVFEQATTTPAPTNGAAPYTHRLLGTTFLRSGLGASVTRSYWVRAVDTSGNLSNWSAIQTGTTLTIEGTQAAPAVPTSVVLASASVANGRSTVTVSWAAGANAVGYEIGVTRSGSAETLLSSGLLATTFECQPGVSFAVRVRSVSNLGVKSAWVTATGSPITSAVDAVAPAALEFSSITAGYGTMWLSWPAAADADFAYYGIKQKTNNTPPAVGINPDYTSTSTAIAVSGLLDSTAYWFWIRTYDTSGNKSAWSAVLVTATTPASAGVTTTALANLIDATSFVSSVKPVEVVATLPATGLVAGRLVFLTTDGKVYRYTTTPTVGWSVATDGADIIANTITGGKIIAGAISTDKLAAGAVTASKILIGDTSNIFPDPLMVDPATFTSALTYSTNWDFSGNSASGSGSSTNLLRILSSVGEVLSLPFPIEEGQTYFFSAFLAALGAGIGQPVLKVRWFSDDSATIAIQTDTIGTTTSSSFVRISGEVVVPVGANARRAIIVFAQETVAPTRNVRFASPTVRLMNKGELIVDGSITADHVSTNQIITNAANIANAVITSAKIVDLAASKIAVGGLDVGITVGVGGTTIGTVDARASDPAARVNAQSTQITPGKISVTGAGTGIGLDGWITSGTTTIDGGEITTNTITAKSILLTDFSNLFLNPSFVNGTEDGWKPDATATVVAKVGTTGILGTMPAQQARKLSATLATSGQATIYYQDGKIPVFAGNQFFYEFQYALEGASLFTLQMRIRSTLTDGTTTLSAVSSIVHAGGSTTWATNSYAYTVPAGVAFIELGYAVRGPMVAGSDAAYVTALSAKRKNNASLIVDGAITATHIQTNTITAASGIIADLAVTSAKIVSLTADKISADTALLNSLTVDGRALSAIGAMEFLNDSFAYSATNSKPQWVKTTGGGTFTYTTDTADAMTSGTLGATSGYVWMRSPERIPFDPTKMYKLTFRVKRVSGTTGNISLGLNGYLADKATLCNTVGAALTTAQHTSVINNLAQNTVPITGTGLWTEYVSYIKGTAATGTLVAGTIASPAKMHTNVKFIEPLAIFNSTTGTSVMRIDMVKIEVVDEDAGAVVNAGVTQITPGKISITAGAAVAGTLDEWISPATTTINGGKITADTVTATQITADSITAKHLTLTDYSNLFLNPQFVGGSLDGWTTVAGSATVAKTGTTGILGTMPGQWTRTYTANLATTANVTAFFQNGKIPVIAGAEHYIEFAWTSNTISATMGVRVRATKTDGTTSVSGSVARTVGAVNVWQKETLVYIVPSDVAFIEISALVRGPMVSGTDIVYMTAFLCKQRVSADLIVNGQITSDKLVTGAFATDGMAIFGGSLQSTGASPYVAGVSGWKIDNAGTAEFNSLVVREDMILGNAVSRSKLIYGKNTSVLSNATYIVYGDTLTGLNGFFRPLVNVGNVASNPLKISFSGRLIPDTGATFPTGVILNVEARDFGSAIWTSIFDGAFAWSWGLKPVWKTTTAGADDRAFYTFIGLDLAAGVPPVQTWDGLRVSAKTISAGSGFTGSQVYLTTLTAQFSQINR